MRFFALIVICALAPATASAQTPEVTFTDLSNRLSVGDDLVVTTVGGESVSGRVARVSLTEFVLAGDSGERAFAGPDLQRVVRRRHGARVGALVGLAVGATAGVVIAAGADDCTFTCFSSPAGMSLFGALGGAIGLGVGAGIGAAVRPSETLFSAASGDGSTTVRQPLAPSVRLQIAW
jgi:hypothetical protein